jgi:hypothetical protein
MRKKQPRLSPKIKTTIKPAISAVRRRLVCGSSGGTGEVGMPLGAALERGSMTIRKTCGILGQEMPPNSPI